MDRNIQKSGLINLLVLLAAGVAGFAVARYANTLAGLVTVIFIAVGVLVAAVSWFQARLEAVERNEKLELDEMMKSRGGSGLFESADSEIFPAQRSREQFERYFVPVFSIILCLAEAAAAIFLWKWLKKTTTVAEVKQPTVALALFALFGLVQFLLGVFSSTIARLQQNRLLRPSAAHLLLSAYLCLAVVLGNIAVWAGYTRVDFHVAQVLVLLLGLVSGETLINLVLEIYRPRVKGKVERPLYESRLVGLLARPVGLITTAAQALDYQFGFKVSETWFYRSAQQGLQWMALLLPAAMIASTCVVFIDSGEQGLLERFGSPVVGRTLLEPGAHLKWFWPVDKVYRFPAERIQSFNIGFTEDPTKDRDTTVLWTVAHTKEDNFLVANRTPEMLEATNAPGGKKTPPVSLITVSIPVQFQITNLAYWAYNNEDAPSLLEDVATREVVRYLAGADMNEIMSKSRLEAGRELVSRIQKASDGHKLGAKIVMVGLEDLHPPVKVAPEYEKVIAALHTKESKILAARAYEVKTNALAGAAAATAIARASSEANERKVGAMAQSALFENQLTAYKAAPAVYGERAYLQTFTRATANARKYVVQATNTHQVLTIDVQDQIRTDLLGTLTPKPAKTN
jgi:regulator of protease activity HflC (stomatin/prohibitin superfamily)